MIRIAILGDIGAGKSFVSKQFNCPLFNADKEVAEIYKNDRSCYQKIKVSKILITNRTKIKSENLKTKFSDIEVVDWGETPAADVVINVTSLGLNPNDKIDLDYKKIGKDKFFYDVIYKPSKTLFLDEAKKRGNIIENGKMMFAYQAQKAFELWNNFKPEINEQVLNLLDD